MPKREKKIVAKKTLNNLQTERPGNDSNGRTVRKNPKKKCSRPNPEDSITVSKKLAEKLKNTKPTVRRSRRTSTCQDESRICGNGKPMPSLADLEKMFEDSDDEEPKISTPKKTQSSAILPQITPEKPILITDDKFNSPRTIKKIADKMMDFISNLSDPIVIEDEPPPPIIPPKKRKKPEVPYIVGCKDRPQVPQSLSVNFCKGDDYGIENNNSNEDDELPKKRAKRTKAVNLSKSIFNAKSEEIAAWLKDVDKAEQSDGSSDSNKTVEYELGARPRTFSPLPSTSKDNDTISQNDKRFVESLVSETASDDSVHSVCTIMNNTNGTIVIDDEVIFNDDNKLDTSDVINVENDNVTTDRNLGNNEVLMDEYDDCYKFVYTDVSDAEIPETIDVDAVIAENKAVIEKYCNVEKFNSVTQVDSSSITASVNRKTELDSAANLGNMLIDSNSNETVPPSNSTTNQIKSIVKNFFQNNSVQNVHLNYPLDNSSSSLNALKSRFENTACDLFSNFTTWIKSYDTTQTKGRIENSNNNIDNEVNHAAHVADNDVIEIVDNYVPAANVSDCTTSRNIRHKRLPKKAKPSTIGAPSDNQSTSCNTVQKTSYPWNHDQVSRIQKRADNPIIRGTQFVVSNMTSQSATNNQDRVYKPPPAYTTLTQPSSVQFPHAELPPVQVSSPVRRSIGDCPICMDNLANNSVASTTCGHIFCMACIKAAIKANGKRCPTCRKPLKGMGFHQLFL